MTVRYELFHSAKPLSVFKISNRSNDLESIIFVIVARIYTLLLNSPKEIEFKLHPIRLAHKIIINERININYNAVI